MHIRFKEESPFFEFYQDRQFEVAAFLDRSIVLYNDNNGMILAKKAEVEIVAKSKGVVFHESRR